MRGEPLNPGQHTAGEKDRTAQFWSTRGVDPGLSGRGGGCPMAFERRKGVGVQEKG